MNSPFLKILFIPLCLISITSCTIKPTYSKDQLKQSVIKLCKDEYGLDVDVAIKGSTLGVYIPIENLITKDLKLNEEAGKKIEDVALSIHRITLSTDMPLKFYTLTARDTNAIGAEFVLKGFVYDVVRVRLLDISRGEYHKRILRDFNFNPAVVGNYRIRMLFEELNKHTSPELGIKNIFYPIYTIGQQGSQRIEIKDIFSKRISEREELFYVKTNEYYVALPGFEVYQSLFPQGFPNEYLFLIDSGMPQNPVKEIVPKYFHSNNEIRQRNLSDTFDQYNDISIIGIDGLPKKDIKMSWFLTEQISRRIAALSQEEKNLSQESTAITSAKGVFENRFFKLELSVNPSASGEDLEAAFSHIIKLMGETLHRYGFEDFEGVELTDTSSKGLKVYITKEDVERFIKGRIKIQDIMQKTVQISQ